MKSWANIYIIGISILSTGVDIPFDLLFFCEAKYAAGPDKAVEVSKCATNILRLRTSLIHAEFGRKRRMDHKSQREKKISGLDTSRIFINPHSILSVN